MYGPFDKQLELRDIAGGAKTSTAAETGVAFAARMVGDFKAIFYVTALDTTTGDETYVLTVETDSAAAFGGTPVEVGRVTVTGKGLFEVPLSGAAVEQRDSDAAAIRVKATLGGTTPSITYGAYLAPAV
jgi:hypothetical protein